MENTNFKFALGSKVRDGLTGFTGVITARVDYLTGPNRYQIEQAAEAGKSHVEAQWFDEPRLDNTENPGL